MRTRPSAMARNDVARRRGTEISVEPAVCMVRTELGSASLRPKYLSGHGRRQRVRGDGRRWLCKNLHRTWGNERGWYTYKVSSILMMSHVARGDRRRGSWHHAPRDAVAAPAGK